MRGPSVFIVMVLAATAQQLLAAPGPENGELGGLLGGQVTTGQPDSLATLPQADLDAANGTQPQQAALQSPAPAPQQQLNASGVSPAIPGGPLPPPALPGLQTEPQPAPLPALEPKPPLLTKRDEEEQHGQHQADPSEGEQSSRQPSPAPSPAPVQPSPQPSNSASPQQQQQPQPQPQSQLPPSPQPSPPPSPQPSPPPSPQLEQPDPLPSSREPQPATPAPHATTRAEASVSMASVDEAASMSPPASTAPGASASSPLPLPNPSPSPPPPSFSPSPRPSYTPVPAPSGGVPAWDSMSCSYAGVQCSCSAPPCDFTTGVTAIRWPNQGLTGPLPAWVAELPVLEVLELRNNSLTGGLPPAWFTEGAFPALQQLLLRNNSLSGTVPSMFGGEDEGLASPPFPQLETLDLGRNAFTGSPPGGAGMKGLVLLGLDHCNFSGPITTGFLEASARAQQVLLSGNQLEGTLPPMPFMPNGGFSQLQVLMLDNNRLSGALPADWAGLTQMRRLGLHGNQFTGTVPVSWVLSWAGQGGEDPLSRVAAAMVGVWPGNPGLCGPAWTAQAQAGALVPLPMAGPGVWGAQLGYTASLFGAQAGPGQGSGGGGQGGENSTAAGCGGACPPELLPQRSLRVTNTFGSCAEACSPAETAVVETNLFDLAWQHQVGLRSLLRVNPGSNLTNAPGAVVQLPCWVENNALTDPAPSYFGGDLAYLAAAMSSQPTLSQAKLLGVASVVSTPPGDPVQWGAWSAGGGGWQGGQEPDFFVVDMGASVEVALLLVLPPRLVTNVSVYVGSDPSSVFGNRLCASGIQLEPGQHTPVLLPSDCQGRYAILYGADLRLSDVQVYPSLADAALFKPTHTGSIGGSSAPWLTDGDAATCQPLEPGQEDLPDAKRRVFIDLGYIAPMAAVAVFSEASSLDAFKVELTNSTAYVNSTDGTLLGPLGARCDLQLATVGEAWEMQYGGACTLLSSARYVVLTYPDSVKDLGLCSAEVYLAQAPAQEQQEGQQGQQQLSSASEDDGGSAGAIAGAVVGGVAGVAVLAGCLALSLSYRRYRHVQRQASKLAAQLAGAQSSEASAAASGGAASGDGMVAAAVLEAMARSMHKSERQILSEFTRMKLRWLQDSALCWCPRSSEGGTEQGGGAPGGHGGGGGGSRLVPLLPLHWGRRHSTGKGGSIPLSNLPSKSSSTQAGGASGSEGQLDTEGGESSEESTAPVPMPPPMLSPRLGLLDFKEVKVGRFLGDGSYGAVYLAHWKHVQVAVKILQRIDPRLLQAGSLGRGGGSSLSNSIVEQTLTELAKEAHIMSQLRHPCIVSYIGASLDPPALVMEYCARGSVYSVLSAAREDPQAAALLTWPRLLRFAWDAARGMLYLHTLRPPVVHRDLKSANLLVDANWHVKVSDFNLARVMEPASVISTLSTANPRWMAPEVIRGDAPSLAADVFSFAVVLWEVMTWELPWPKQNPFQIANTVTSGGRLALPPPDKLPAGELLVYDDYVALICSCWQEDAAMRPTFEVIVPKLQEMVTKVVHATRSSRQLAP